MVKVSGAEFGRSEVDSRLNVSKGKFHTLECVATTQGEQAYTLFSISGENTNTLVFTLIDKLSSLHHWMLLAVVQNVHPKTVIKYDQSVLYFHLTSLSFSVKTDASCWNSCSTLVNSNLSVTLVPLSVWWLQICCSIVVQSQAQQEEHFYRLYPNSNAAFSSFGSCCLQVQKS